jgi:hypothetical protein
MPQDLLSALETGPLRRFADWPDPTVPKVTARVKTIHDLTKILEKRLETENQELVRIRKELGEITASSGGSDAEFDRQSPKNSFHQLMEQSKRLNKSRRTET